MRAMVLLLAGILLFPAAYCQFYYYNERYYDRPLILEAGISSGYMNCLTDLGGNAGQAGSFLKDVHAASGKPFVALSLAARYQSAIGLRIALTRGAVQAADSLIRGSPPADHRYWRNLHFRSLIREVTVLAEWYPLTGLARSDRKLRCMPYLLAGIGLFSFDPVAVLEGRQIRLQPLKTEGQGLAEYPHRPSYALTQWNFPTGIGINYEAGAIISLRLETVYRFLQTDYLDDVSTRYIPSDRFYRVHDPQTAQVAARLADQRRGPARNIPGAIRGNPENKDGYFTLAVSLGIALNRKAIR